MREAVLGPSCFIFAAESAARVRRRGWGQGDIKEARPTGSGSRRLGNLPLSARALGPAGEHAAHPEVTTAGGRTASVVSCSSRTVRVSPWRVGAAHISKTVVIIPSLGGRLPFSFLSLPPE